MDDWPKIKEASMRGGTIDFIRGKISGEEYERIQNQTYEAYRDNFDKATKESARNMSSGEGASTAGGSPSPLNLTRNKAPGSDHDLMLELVHLSGR